MYVNDCLNGLSTGPKGPHEIQYLLGHYRACEERLNKKKVLSEKEAKKRAKNVVDVF